MFAWLSLPSIWVTMALRLPEEASLYLLQAERLLTDACLRALDSLNGCPIAHEKGPLSLTA